MSDPPDGSAPDIDDVTLAQPSTTHAVEMIGPYRLLQRVGEGGMGDVWLAEHKLSVGDRLDLFLQVCDGVQHAHQRGILHRDLKPSNILVTVQDDRPVPKIIDFGIAKATSQQRAGDERPGERGDNERARQPLLVRGEVRGS